MPQTLRTRIQMLAAAMLVTVAALLLGAGATRAAGVQTFTVPQPSAGLNDMALGPGGNLYFTEGNAVGGAYHIGSITPSGTFGPPVAVPVGQYDNPGEGPTNILSSGGSLWFRSDIGNVIDRFAPGGSLTTVFGDPDIPDLDYTTSLGPSDAGGVWATDYDGDEQPGDQTDLRLFPANAGAGTTPQYLAATYSATWFPTPLVLGSNGNVWYTDDSDYLRSTSDAGATQSYPISGIPLGAPNALAFDGKGDLWFVSQYPGTAFTAAGDGAVGELPAGAGAATATALDSNIAPTSIAKGPDGNMYFGYIVSGNSPDGGIGQINTATGKVTLADLSGFQPASVTFTPDGALWFVDSGLNQIDRVMPSSLFGGGSGPGPWPGPRSESGSGSGQAAAGAEAVAQGARREARERPQAQAADRHLHARRVGHLHGHGDDRGGDRQATQAQARVPAGEDLHARHRLEDAEAQGLSDAGPEAVDPRGQGAHAGEVAEADADRNLDRGRAPPPHGVEDRHAALSRPRRVPDPQRCPVDADP